MLLSIPSVFDRFSVVNVGVCTAAYYAKEGFALARPHLRFLINCLGRPDNAIYVFFPTLWIKAEVVIDVLRLVCIPHDLLTSGFGVAETKLNFGDLVDALSEAMCEVKVLHRDSILAIVDPVHSTRQDASQHVANWKAAHPWLSVFIECLAELVDYTEVNGCNDHWNPYYDGEHRAKSNVKIRERAVVVRDAI